jgi:hypothetical protein
MSCNHSWRVNGAAIMIDDINCALPVKCANCGSEETAIGEIPTITLAELEAAEVCRGCYDHPNEERHPRRSIDCWPPQPRSRYFEEWMRLRYEKIEHGDS